MPAPRDRGGRVGTHEAGTAGDQDLHANEHAPTPARFHLSDEPPADYAIGLAVPSDPSP